jgi:hypothetical protein
MRNTILGVTALISAVAFAGSAQAGCVKGAIVGGIAGHMAGHGVVGAAAGCAIGHHRSAKQKSDVDATGSVRRGPGAYGDSGDDRTRRY